MPALRRRLAAAFPALCLSVLLAGHAPAQVVRGTVIGERGRPVKGALVRLLDSNSDQVASALSNGGGHFLLTTRADGAHTLEVRHIAYGTTRTASFDVPPNGSVEVEVRLDPVAIPIDPLTVVGVRESVRHENTLEGFYARHARSPAVGSNRVLARTDPEFSEALDVRDVMRSFRPVVNPDPEERERRRGMGSREDGACPSPVVFWDGVRVGSPEAANELLRTSTVHLEGMEYYRTLSDAPFAYRGGLLPSKVRNCAIIAVWSRRGG